MLLPQLLPHLFLQLLLLEWLAIGVEAGGINTITFLFFRYKDHFGTYDRMSGTDEISEQLGNQIFQLK